MTSFRPTNDSTLVQRMILMLSQRMIFYNSERANRARMFMSHPQCLISAKVDNPKFVSRRVAIMVAYYLKNRGEKLFSSFAMSRVLVFR